MIRLLILLIPLFLIGCKSNQKNSAEKSYSGIYPHLAYYNNEGECGTGAVVPWADRLWVITYGPHLPFGSSDKLYEITPDLHQIVRTESMGGTPANRMIHKESNQLFMGPYAIDSVGNVRVIPVSQMPGRLTGNARHLDDPANKIYVGTMEEGFYEVDVKSLKVTTLYQDGNVNRKAGEMAQHAELLPGAHGKGLYSGQGVMVFSNNGEANQSALEKYDVESGVLAEWNGKDWTIIRRNQFVEVTGPGGIYGNKNPETDPIWVTGWDYKSVLVGVRGAGKWNFYRLPKASHAYDGAHGWNTEWPRIRNVGTLSNPEYLMTMHGMFWHFPETFTSETAAGIRPRTAYLKVIGDFVRWNDQLVFGCDDSAQKEFLNKRKIKGNIEGPGQSNSNLWFTDLNMPDMLGPNTAEGAVWLSEQVQANETSEPFLFAGWDNRSVWIKNEGPLSSIFSFELDLQGNHQWKAFHNIKVDAGASVYYNFSNQQKGEWIRVNSSEKTIATVHFTYKQNEKRSPEANEQFDGIARINENETIGGLLWSLGDNRKTLGVLAGNTHVDGFSESGYYELDGSMNLIRKNDTITASVIREKLSIPQKVVSIDGASVLIIDDNGRRWRLPKGESSFDSPTEKGLLRMCREVATERDLMNCLGTFYELPAENADGFAKIRPVSSHQLKIHDYASYRGMLVLTGIQQKEISNEHIICSADGKAAVWVGVIDDLWKMGKPRGQGGPWFNTSVKKDEPSDPYLIGFYDHRTLKISHNASETVTFLIQTDPIGNGCWMDFTSLKVESGKSLEYIFPDGFESRWIRFVANTDCHATTILNYN